uniref:Plasmodium yoelii subtelomeric region (PYST-C1) n=1 Tax=Strongyloides venezuelensis TaxID=75913 RepID=A0A0K0F037_STRVS
MILISIRNLIFIIFPLIIITSSKSLPSRKKSSIVNILNNFLPLEENNNNSLEGKDNYSFNEDILVYRKKERASGNNEDCGDNCNKSDEKPGSIDVVEGDEFTDYNTTVKEYISGRKTHRD